ncbi:MAG: hypothetical protein PHS32_05960 [Rhodoferax sp.]|uniref:hypothetical protein n=1 Tax=Rhodoferax sp. TaxID=50421 RepID=UPI00261BE8E2|nr:hypothetical protein [Rhodoferax sp.]MDD5333275.1 hypothetical protein [Rhodoferax sp.]
MSTRYIAWLCFSVSIAAAWLLAEYGWMLAWRLEGMIALALVTVCFGVWVLINAPRKRNTLPFVAVGLIIGNWRMLEGALMLVFWSINGFAP